MMQCRMCSQRMTRAGKLCRECERELERARQVGATVGESARDAFVDVPASAGWPWMLRAPVVIIAAAFAAGVAGAVALHVADASRGRVASRSVMVDAVLSPGLRQISLGVSQPPSTEPDEVNVKANRRVAAAPPARARQAVSPPALAQQTVSPPLMAAPEVRQVAIPMPPSRASGAHANPAHALDDALARCADEAFFARPACEERARTRHCADAAAPLPQCAAPTREYGQ